MSAVQPLEPGHGVEPYAFHRPPRTGGHLAYAPFASCDRSVPLYVPKPPPIPLDWLPILKMSGSLAALFAAGGVFLKLIGAL